MSILLNENWDGLGTWADADTDTGVSEIDPAGQLRLDTKLSAAGDGQAGRYKTIVSCPDLATMNMRLYCDALGAAWNDGLQLSYGTATWKFVCYFHTGGLIILKTGGANTEVGVDIVSTGVWVDWRFQIDKSGGEAAAVVEVFKDNVSQGTVDCDYEVASSNGLIQAALRGYLTDNLVCHIDYLRIATGLGKIQTPQCLIL